MSVARTPKRDRLAAPRRRGAKPAPRGPARREALLEAVLQLVADVGADAVTHRRVAEVAGLPLASTTYWFASKEHLLTAALELAKANITVNTIAPGFTETDMFAKVPANIQEQIKARIPVGRFAHPEEIAKAVIFLAADGAYITGQQINVNGGAYM